MKIDDESGEIKPESKIEFKKEYWFGPTDGPAPNIEPLPYSEGSMDEVSEWFQRKLMEVSKIPAGKFERQKSFWDILKFWKWKE